MRLLAAIPLFVLTLACDAADPVCEAPPAAFRGIWENGTSAQGSTMQGSKLQGVWENGVWQNGIWQNGARLQGIALTGTGLALRGTELVADPAVDPSALVGATVAGRLSDGSTIELALADAWVEDDLHLYALTFEGKNVCGPDGHGLFVPGVWEEDGSRRDAVADASAYAVTFSCMDGVIAKCVVWGYRPWEVGADVHQACTRLARADYCGDGISYTRDNTEIDVYDDLGVQVPTSDRPDFEFEAGWGPDGATCVSRPRYHEIVVGEGEALPPCWEDKPTCDTPEAARDLGATLFNESVDQERLLCTPR